MNKEMIKDTEKTMSKVYKNRLVIEIETEEPINPLDIAGFIPDDLNVVRQDEFKITLLDAWSEREDGQRIGVSIGTKKQSYAQGGYTGVRKGGVALKGGIDTSSYAKLVT